MSNTICRNPKSLDMKGEEAPLQHESMGMLEFYSNCWFNSSSSLANMFPQHKCILNFKTPFYKGCTDVHPFLVCKIMV